jgi:GT2 family glycosyltransferase
MSNLAGYRSAFQAADFDEEFLWAEDTDYFSRLKSMGYRLVQVNTAPVIHLRKLRSKRQIRRAFRYGLYWAKLRHRYTDPVEIAGFSQVAKMLVARVLNLLGLAVGYVIFFGERRYRTGSGTTRDNA